MTANIAILASGSGSVAQSLLDASSGGDLAGASVIVLLSDRAGAGALERARAAGVDAVVHRQSGTDRSAYSAEVAAMLQERGVDLVCLSGFMKILAPSFVKEFPERILNTHPALLPAFPGAHPVRDSLEWGVKVTGATVHLVDEEVDHGPIVMQEAVEVLDDDDEESLHARIKAVEQRLYPAAVRAMAGGKLRVEGRKVLIS